MRRLILPVLLAAGLVAPAATAPVTAAAAAAAKPATDRACFRSDDLRNFRAVDDRTVNLLVGARDVYQAQLFGTCSDIETALSVGIRTRGGASFICSGLDLDLVVPGSIGPQTCPITSLRKLSPEEVAALPKKQRP